MFNKRGISDVVATVLIILVTVAAATIVWITVIPMIQNKMAPGTACLDALSQVEIGVAEGYTCYESVDPTAICSAIDADGEDCGNPLCLCFLPESQLLFQA